MDWLMIPMMDQKEYIYIVAIQKSWGIVWHNQSRCRISPGIFFPCPGDFFSWSVLFSVPCIYPAASLPCCMLLAAFWSWNLSFSVLFAAFWSWTFHAACYLQHFGAGTFYFTCYLPHLGAGTFYLSCYLPHLRAGNFQFACYL